MTDAPPELLAHPDYETVRALGRGGMGSVYLVRNRLLDRLEVMKVVSPANLTRPEVYGRFLQEIRAAARLQHQNVVAAYAAVRLGDALGFVMEYVDGDNLDDLVRVHGPVSVSAACRYLVQVCQGLQHAFERGMVHRDIKPANLIRSRTESRSVVKILDFGLAKAVSEEPTQNGLTYHGQVLGTPAYMAPEQMISAATADTRADLYSVGCCLYFLLNGRPPFEAASIFDLFDAHQNARPMPLDALRPDAPPGLAAIAARLLAKEPTERFQTPFELAQVLLPFTRSEQAQPRSHSHPGLATPQPGKMAETVAQVVTPAAPLNPAPVKPASTPRPPSVPDPTGTLVAAPPPADPWAFEQPTEEAVVPRWKQTSNHRPVWLIPVCAVAAVLLLAALLGVLALTGKSPSTQPSPAKKLTAPGR